MDNNRDGIIDDPIATKKKVGRKSLGLTPDEMKLHREALRRARRAKKREAEREEAFEALVTEVNYLHMNGLAKEEIVKSLAKNKKFAISYQPNANVLSGFKGDRIRRERN